MATRSIIRFAKREEGVSFNEHPDTWDAQFYAHWDGYESHRGVEIAESILNGRKIEGWEIDFLSTRHCDLEYCYYVWQHPLKETWISIFRGLGVAEDMECIFVGKPQKLIDKYRRKTQEELDEDNNQAILNAEDPNYPEGDDGSIDYKPNTNKEG